MPSNKTSEAVCSWTHATNNSPELSGNVVLGLQEVCLLMSCIFTLVYKNTSRPVVAVRLHDLCLQWKL